jgi:hypothetical protein
MRGMGPADRDRHPPDPAGNRIARNDPAMMQRLDRNAFIETQCAQALRRAILKRRPADSSDCRVLVQGKFVKSHAVSVSMI